MQRREISKYFQCSLARQLDSRWVGAHKRVTAVGAPWPVEADASSATIMGAVMCVAEGSRGCLRGCRWRLSLQIDQIEFKLFFEWKRPTDLFSHGGHEDPNGIKQ